MPPPTPAAPAGGWADLQKKIAAKNPPPPPPPPQSIPIGKGGGDNTPYAANFPSLSQASTTKSKVLSRKPPPENYLNRLIEPIVIEEEVAAVNRPGSGANPAKDGTPQVGLYPPGSGANPAKADTNPSQKRGRTKSEPPVSRVGDDDAIPGPPTTPYPGPFPPNIYPHPSVSWMAQDSDEERSLLRERMAAEGFAQAQADAERLREALSQSGVLPSQTPDEWTQSTEGGG